MPETFTFLHLSDIHFTRWSGDKYDLDQDLRSQLENDIQELCKISNFDIDAIFVTGDIAFSGKAKEYRIAEVWLNEICQKLECEPMDVWVTPGNHDVDRQCIKDSRHLRDIHQKIQQTDPENVAHAIMDYCRDEIFGPGIFKPLEQYVSFAAKFGCDINHSDPWWEKKALTILDGDVEIRIRGLNSVLISSENDKPRNEDEPGNLVLGLFQVPKKVSNVEYITLCHHPQNWILDENQVADFLDQRSRIQLYGHTHEYQIERRNGALRLNAGALHPERNHENWQPRYNLVQVSISTEPNLVMKVKIYPRTWNLDAHRFWSDQDEKFLQTEYELPLQKNEIVDNISNMEASMINIDTETEEKVVEQDNSREVVYRYLRLSFFEKMRIAQELLLLENEDENLLDIDKFKRVLERVRLRQLTNEFLDHIKAAEEKIAK